MKAVIVFVLFILGSVSTDLAGECTMASFYLELGCVPEAASDKGPCPVSFKCPDLHPDPTKCYYKGVSYPDKESIPEGVVSNPCSQACSCGVYNGETQFFCAAVDCYESFDSDINQECIYTFELNSCCSTGSVCGKDAIANLKTCLVDGVVYREGQMFEPMNTKKSCICTKEFNGSTDNPLYCRDIDCGIEIHYQYNIQKSCAPVYANNKGNCPISFQCPTAKSKVIRGLNIKNLTAQCTFGNMTMSIGDEVSVDDSCTKCTCSVPPFVTCVKKNFCGTNSDF